MSLEVLVSSERVSAICTEDHDYCQIWILGVSETTPGPQGIASVKVKAREKKKCPNKRAKGGIREARRRG